MYPANILLDFSFNFFAVVLSLISSAKWQSSSSQSKQQNELRIDLCAFYSITCSLLDVPAFTIIRCFTLFFCCWAFQFLEKWISSSVEFFFPYQWPNDRMHSAHNQTCNHQDQNIYSMTWWTIFKLNDSIVDSPQTISNCVFFESAISICISMNACDWWCAAIAYMIVWNEANYNYIRLKCSQPSD